MSWTLMSSPEFKSDVENVAACVKEKMESALPLDVPIVVDVAWDFAWAKGK